MELELLERQMDLNMEIDKVRAEIEAAAPSVSAFAPLSAPESGSAPSTQQRKKQLTMANWVFVKDSEDSLMMTKLQGPLAISLTSLVCPDCGSEKKNMNGLHEHMRHCRASQARLEQERAARLALEASRAPRNHTLDSDESESDRESCEGHVLAPVPAASATAALPKPKSNRRGQAVRKSYSALFKWRVISFCDACDAGAPGASGKSGSKARTSRLFKVSESMVSRWVKGRADIMNQARIMLGARGRGNVGRPVSRALRGPQAHFTEAEALVFGKFLAARQKNRAVSGRILKVWMRKAVMQLYADSQRATGFVASTTWLQRFKSRHNIVTRRRTNKKVLAIEARLPAVRKFHRDLRAFVSQPGGAEHEVYGRFAPQAIFNVDQSPIALQPGAAVTLEERGAVKVQVAARDSGDKRYCTLQITVSPGPEQVKPMLIFHGQGKRISAQEKAAWDPRVHVEFQPSAWVDSNMVKTYVAKVLKPFLDANGIGEALLFMDNLAAQQTEDARATYADNCIVPFFFPPNVTDLVQPVDHHLAQQLKQKMADLLDVRLVNDDMFGNKWLGLEDGTMPAWEVRVELTRLAADAWEYVCQKRDMVKLFQETGCLMPKLGADSTGVAPIKIAGVDVYSFELPPGQPVAALPPLPPPPPPPPPPPQDDDESLISEDEGEEAEATRAADAEACAQEAQEPSAAPNGAAAVPLPIADGDDNVDEENEDKLQVDVEEDADRNEFADETADESAWGAGVAVPPVGFALSAAPPIMPAPRSLINRKVFWAIPVTALGGPGWIVSAVNGGPLTPSSALMGVTMRLKCTKRMDKTTPNDFLKEHVEVAFNLDNYGKRWYLLDEVDG